MPFCLLFSLDNLLNQFVSYKAAQRMRTDPVVAVLEFMGLMRFNSSVRGPDEFIVYDFATDTLHCYPAERLASRKCQKFADGPVLPVLAPAVDVS